MRNRGRTFAGLWCTCAFFLVTQRGAAQQDRAALVSQSDIVFVGTVARVGAASVSGVAVSPRTTVVRVDEVLDKPSAVALAAGDSVTVEAREAGSLREGMQATFYTSGWLYGRGVAVREVGHEAVADGLPAGALAQQRDSILGIRRQVSDTALRARVRAADMIVVGRVEAVRAATAQTGPGRRVSEHDAAWQEAVILVESAMKGGQAGQRVVVRFPGSLDVAWRATPRFTTGQEGTFLLRQDTISGSPNAMIAGKEVPAYTALSPQDVLSKQDAQRVQALSRP